ncbi:acyltransferase, partial [Teladorsagia circumcincta]
MDYVTPSKSTNDRKSKIISQNDANEMMTEGVIQFREIRIPVAPNESFCLMSSVQHLISEDYVWAMVPIVLWATAVIYGTINVASVFSSLSIRRSFKELTMERHSQLDVLDVFRVLAIIWVMVNHTGSEGRIHILERLPSAEKFKEAMHNHPIFGALLGNSALGVEIFLVLSGLLCARTWLRKADQPFARHYRIFLIRRILRLLPSVIFFMYIFAGPITKHFLPRFHSSMISACGAKGITSHLTLTGNWQSTPTCLGYLWYLGLDMQLYIMAPFLLHALYKQPVRGRLLCMLLITMSMFIRAGYCSAYGVCHKSDVDIPFISYPEQDPSTLGSIYGGLWEMYSRPYTKCGPFILGLLVGTASMSMKPSLDRHKSRCIASAFFGLSVAVIYAILPQYWFGDYLQNYNLYYTATFRTVFSIGICGMIWAFISRLE